MTIKSQLDTLNKTQLEKDLNWLFKQHNLKVSAVLTNTGVKIISNDSRVIVDKL